MKKLLVVLMLALVLPKVGSANDLVQIGIRGGMSKPIGADALHWDPRPYVGLVAAFVLEQNVALAIGTSFARITRGDYIVSTNSPDEVKALTCFAGPQFVAPLTTSQTSALYILPALTAGHTFFTHQKAGNLRIGIDLGAGLMVSLGDPGVDSAHKIEIGGTYSMTNILVKQGLRTRDWGGSTSPEVDINMFNIHIGFIF